jgi:hypothetical protein
MRFSTLGPAASVAALATVAALAPAASAAPGPAVTATAWSVSHGQSSASGTWHTTPDGALRTFKLQGELTNKGSGCSAVWVLWSVSIPQKIGSKCGAGTKAVSHQQLLRPTMGGQIAVCKGNKNTDDCTWKHLL